MDGNPLIPSNIKDIYQSCLFQVSDPDDIKCLENLSFEAAKIDEVFCVVIGEVSKIQALYPSTPAMVLSRNLFMAYLTYRITRIKMLNSLVPSLN